MLYKPVDSPRTGETRRKMHSMTARHPHTEAGTMKTVVAHPLFSPVCWVHLAQGKRKLVLPRSGSWRMSIDVLGCQAAL